MNQQLLLDRNSMHVGQQKHFLTHLKTQMDFQFLQFLLCAPFIAKQARKSSNS